MELTTAGWLLLALASALVGLAKGGLAMVGMLAVPILSLAMSPVQAAGVLLPVYVVSDIFGLIAYRRHWDRRVLARLLPGSVAGIALGWATASLVNDAAVGELLGMRIGNGGPDEPEFTTPRDRLLWAMERTGWVQAKAGRLLGLTTRQVSYALRKYNIEIKRF